VKEERMEDSREAAPAWFWIIALSMTLIQVEKRREGEREGGKE
jgi:hypothetical protein